MTKTIEIVDHGRGPQLSTSRITVQDVVPYLERKLTHEQILEIMPALNLDELQTIERYVEKNYEAVMEQDRCIKLRNANRKNPPEIDEILQRGGKKMAALREEFKKKKAEELNGDYASR